VLAVELFLIRQALRQLRRRGVLRMLWRIRLIGGLALEREGSGQAITLFRSRKTAGLLAYLALFPRRHTRETLIALFWPEDELEQGRQSLRTALTSLRKQLEPPDIRPGSVLEATRTHISLHPNAIITDVAELERAIKQRDVATVQRLAIAPLLPEFYDDWAIDAAERLAALLSDQPASELASVERATERSVVIAPKRIGVPPSLDRFFGRVSEQGALKALFDSGISLITLIGAGGAGKSRLATEIAAQWSGMSAFVALADLEHADRIAEQVAARLGTPQSNEPALQRAASVFASEAAPLLVLDNLEQLVGTELSLFLQSLRALAPQLRILVTSRQRLGVRGERLVPLPSLPLPEKDVRLVDLASVPSVALFLDRAQSCRGDFQLTLRNAESISQLLSLLDGMPLAIELAASWIGVLTPDQMRERYQASLLSLGARKGRTEAEGRHRSLWATALWSYNLLPENLQHLFCALSVFRGGGTTGAIQSVASPESTAIEEAIVRLSERSLVRLTDGNARYTLPEALREFAQERLSEDKDKSAETTKRHATYFTQLSLQLEKQLATVEQHAALKQCDLETNNFLAAFDGTLEDFSVDGARQALSLSSALWRFWEPRGLLIIAKNTLEKALAHPRSQDSTLCESCARVLGGLGIIAIRQCDYESAERYQEEALRLRRFLADPTGVAIALNNLAMVHSASENYAATQECLTEAALILRTASDHFRLSTVLNALGKACLLQSQFDIADGYFSEAESLQRESNNKIGLVYTLINRATYYDLCQDTDSEFRLLLEALTLCRELGDVLNGATAILNISDILLKDLSQTASVSELEKIIFLISLGESARTKNSIALVTSDYSRREQVNKIIRPRLDPALYAAAELHGRNAEWHGDIDL
jgi:predicted ATPase